MEGPNDDSFFEKSLSEFADGQQWAADESAQAEVRQFDSLLAGRTSYRTLNIYGPGGIGKTVVCDKLSSHARACESPVGFVDGSAPNLTADRVLHGFVQSLADGPSGARMQKTFRDFEQQFHDYLIVNQILERSGGT